VPGHRHRDRDGQEGPARLTGGGDEEAIARGIFDTYQTTNLRYSQLAPLDMYKEVNTGTTCRRRSSCTPTDGDAYKFLFMAKGGGSANKSYLYQETKALLNPKSLLAFVESKAAQPRHRRLPAVPPRGRHRRHLGRVRAQDRQARQRALPRHLPTEGNKLGHGFRDLELEAAGPRAVARTGIGAQFGGKYFCHDVRVIRLPRHGASCPVGIAVSCSADRQASGKITRTACSSSSSSATPRTTCPRSDATTSSAGEW
jgi:fumarate hydratase class I